MTMLYAFLRTVQGLVFAAVLLVLLAASRRS